MATLQRIRNRAGLLVGVIGVAMLAFILTDLLSSGGSILQRSQNEIGSVDGETITAQEFQALLEKSIQVKFPNGQASEEERTQERDLLWNTIIRDRVLGTEYEELGISVSEDELDDLITGSRTGNLHTMARQLFGIQPGDEVNSAMIKQNLNNVLQNDPQNAALYRYYEKEILRQRLKEKYDNLIKNGFYATNASAVQYNKEQNASVNARYVFKSYSSIPDSTIKVSQSDLKSYYKKNKEEYKQDASRGIEYVVFEIKPSVEDRANVKETITSLLDDQVVFNKRSNAYDTLPGFAKTTEDSAFVQRNSDFPFDGRYFKEGKLSDTLNKVMFDTEVGFIYGPYEENGSYHISKLIEVTSRPDSVQARHILIRPENNNLAAAKAVADSLMGLINEGVDFAELAKENSTDGSAEKGGDLGWFAEGAMVGPFNDACFSGKTGELKLVLTQFGYHIIEITDQKDFGKAVKIATVSRTIDASSNTSGLVYEQASQFAAQNKDLESFRTAASSNAIQKREAKNLLVNAFTIAGLGQAREIVRWTHDEKTDIGAVRMFDMSDKFVVAILTEMAEKGYTPMEKVELRLRSEIIKDKKAERFVEEMKANKGADIDATATALGLEVKTMSAVKHNAASIPGVGYEPAVIGTAFGLKTGVQSKPVVGNNGVFVLVVDNLTEAPALADVANIKRIVESKIGSRVSYEPYGVLEDKADVVDDRAKIY